MSAAIGKFLAMGGYAQFVWPAYGFALVVLGGFVLYARRRYRASEAALAELQSRLRPRR